MLNWLVITNFLPHVTEPFTHSAMWTRAGALQRVSSELFHCTDQVFRVVKLNKNTEVAGRKTKTMRWRSSDAAWCEEELTLWWWLCGFITAPFKKKKQQSCDPDMEKLIIAAFLRTEKKVQDANCANGIKVSDYKCRCKKKRKKKHHFSKGLVQELQWFYSN